MANAQPLLFPFFLGIGLLAPGWLLGRALRIHAGFLGAFLGSAALLINLILLVDAAGIALTGPHIAAGLTVTCLILAAISKLGKAPPAPPPAPFFDSWRKFRWRPQHWLLIPAALGISAVILKASLDPLSGLDTKFRWNFLALQMLREGNLHFYPAITAEDFLHYSWCDGIAPLVSSLYFWTYLSLGQPFPWATAPVVIGQALLLFSVVYQLAEMHGKATGYSAVAVLATSGVFLSGVAIGQETGLTALSLLATFVFVERYRAHPIAGWLVWAGIAAGVGGLAREYGLIFCAIGSLRLIHRKLPLRDWASFLLPALLVSGPWYLRNWTVTGNPLYSHELHGLFPTNPVHTEYIQTVNETLGFKANPHAVSTLVKIAAQLTGVSTALALAGLVRHPRQLWFWPLASIFIICLWLWSVGQTSAGYVYSLRVLTPAIAMGAICGGVAVSRWAASPRSWILALLLAIPSIDAAERTLFMPLNPFPKWWRETPSTWLKSHDESLRWDRDPNWKAVKEAVGAERVVAIDPFTFTLMIQLGVKTVPYFSPEVSFLFDPQANYSGCRSRLRNAGVRFIILPPESTAIVHRQLSRHPFFVALRTRAPCTSTTLYLAYDLYPAQTPPAPPAIDGNP